VTASYIPRIADAVIAQRLAEFPAVMLVGPRASGKTTTALRIAADVVRLDAPAEAGVFRADPDAALASRDRRPLLLDEWQDAPEVIGAVKRAVDAGAPPGSFLLTGSVQSALDDRTWPGTGRIAPIMLGPLTIAERLGRLDGDWISPLLTGDLEWTSRDDAPDLIGYVDLALAGGFPEPALRLSDAGRTAWYGAYVGELATRDVRAVLRRADPDRVRRYIEALALSSAGVVDHRTIYTAAGVTRATADSYDAILERLHVVATIPAWSTSRLSALTARPKRYLVDGGLLAAAARFTRADVLRDAGLLGRLVETFVHAQLRPSLAGRQPAVRLSHLRTEKGRHEVDLILDLGGTVLAIEIKSTSAPARDDARHLAWLRDRVGDDFAAGVVLHTGPDAFRLGDRLYAVPIAALWS
jgi:uncharacterized protein